MGTGERIPAELRAERRAAALRENLKRRKAQARAQSAAARAPLAGDLPAPGSANEKAGPGPEGN